MHREGLDQMYDIVFISFDEKIANDRYFEFVTSFDGPNNIFRVHGVEGIKEAHLEAAQKVTTDMFYVIDADAKLVPKFKFNLKLNPTEEDIVHVWRSINPVNMLEYGHGGVKLLPTKLVLNMDISAPDMTTSISKRFKFVDKISNINQFNVDPLSTWRTAFRECVKLSSKIIPGQLDDETTKRLKSWLYQGGEKKFGEYSKSGASAGKWYGETCKDDTTALSKINDYSWLEIQFNEHIKMFPPVETFKDLEDPAIIREREQEREREREREQEQERELTQDEKINFWRSAFREAAATKDKTKLYKLLYRGINEYTRSGASAGKWWGETYRKDKDKMKQIKDDEFLKGEYYWHTENHPVSQFK